MSFQLSGQSGSFLAVLKFLQLKLKYATFEGGFFMWVFQEKEGIPCLLYLIQIFGLTVVAKRSNVNIRAIQTDSFSP